eukprot:Skav218472  [mRNA]  locus=scaffold538:1042602:1044116:+ [translate_table: standard]
MSDFLKKLPRESYRVITAEDRYDLANDIVKDTEKAVKEVKNPKVLAGPVQFSKDGAEFDPYRQRWGVETDNFQGYAAWKDIKGVPLAQTFRPEAKVFQRFSSERSHEASLSSDGHLQVAGSSSSSPGDKVIFAISDSDEAVRRYKGQCRAELESKTLKELEEIRQKAEESMQTGMMRYRAAYAVSHQKIDKEDCGAQGRLEALNRQLMHSRLLQNEEETDISIDMVEKLLILQQIQKELPDLPELGKEEEQSFQQTLERQTQEARSRIDKVEMKVKVCQEVDGKCVLEIQKELEQEAQKEFKQSGIFFRMRVPPASGHQPQVVLCAAASGGAAGSGSPAPAALPATPETGHVLLSGRFKSDDFFSCEQIRDYMRAVKRRLETRGIPAFMMDARLGQSSAELTHLGLGRAKGMVAFCTSEYGAYTGVGYESFLELEFAYDKQLPIFPIKLCEDWPPAPKDNDKGIWQNKLIFTSGRLYIEDKQMQDAEGMADKIADDIELLGLFS